LSIATELQFRTITSDWKPGIELGNLLLEPTQIGTTIPHTGMGNDEDDGLSLIVHCRNTEY